MDDYAQQSRAFGLIRVVEPRTTYRGWRCPTGAPWWAFKVGGMSYTLGGFR